MAVTNKLSRREKIKFRIRKKIVGTTERPRLCVFRSNAEIYAQIIDDENTLSEKSKAFIKNLVKSQEVI